MTKTTHFGFNAVAETEKARKVAGVFDSVAERYNLMNDLCRRAASTVEAFCRGNKQHQEG